MSRALARAPLPEQARRSEPAWELRGGTPEKVQNMPPRLVTKDNLNDPDVQKQLKPDLEKYLK